VASLLTGDFVSESAKRLYQIVASDVPRQTHQQKSAFKKKSLSLAIPLVPGDPPGDPGFMTSPASTLAKTLTR